MGIFFTCKARALCVIYNTLISGQVFKSLFESLLCLYVSIEHYYLFIFRWSKVDSMLKSPVHVGLGEIIVLKPLFPIYLKFS